MGLQTAPDNNGLRMDTILLQLSKIASYFTTSTYITPNELKLPIQTKKKKKKKNNAPVPCFDRTSGV
jgi:hypothetical protein